MNPNAHCTDPLSTILAFCYQRQLERENILSLIDYGYRTDDSGSLYGRGTCQYAASCPPAWRTDPFRELEFPVDFESGRFVFRRHFRKIDDIDCGTDPFVVKIEFRIPCENENGHDFVDSFRLRCESGRISGDTFGNPPWLVEEVQGDDTVWRPDACRVRIMCARTDDGSVEWQMEALRSFCSTIGTELIRRDVVPTNKRLEFGPGLDEI